MGGDFNARTTTLLDTIDINGFNELLQAPELIEIEQLGVMAKH